ncbi:gamma-aminobutyric acid type b receptor subunit 2 [Plakobranchus ocellatus]|uniref:Gamma-aminobutyric acid type b receptor subunit 2 n=1 Tax=Plakobranchus ocellatus TaxID=259542 RepID=A0AAV3YUP2_9GAST|nr:gamma-aminobutyric acid type b receptor subunit 2 [Plakobranchus ocellatus]
MVGDATVQVGLYDTRSQTLSTDGYAQIKWHNERVPRDQSKRSKLQLYISAEIFVPIATLACLGMALASAFLVFNLKYKNLRVIKLSSPMMNNFILLGSVLAYMSVILYGLDGQNLGSKSFQALCTIRLGFLCLGFSVAFGAMFSKTWRVYSIMAKKNTVGISKVRRSTVSWRRKKIFCISMVREFTVSWRRKTPFASKHKGIYSDMLKKSTVPISKLREFTVPCEEKHR